VLFEVDVDVQARRWLDTHPPTRTLVIDYDVHRCCGGGKICAVSVHPESSKDGSRQYARGITAAGMDVLIDPRAASRLPRRFGLTTSGVGRWKHLDLRLEPADWGELLWA